MAQRLLEFSDHAIGLCDVHVSVVLRSWCQFAIWYIQEIQELFTVRNTLLEVVGNQIHVTKILMSILYQVLVSFLDLRPDFQTVGIIICLRLWSNLAPKS